MRFPFFTSTSAAASGEKDENDTVRGDRSGAQRNAQLVARNHVHQIRSRYGRNPQILETIEKFLDVLFAHVPNVINPHNNMPVTESDSSEAIVTVTCHLRRRSPSMGCG